MQLWCGCHPFPLSPRWSLFFVVVVVVVCWSFLLGDCSLVMFGYRLASWWAPFLAVASVFEKCERCGRVPVNVFPHSEDIHIQTSNGKIMFFWESLFVRPSSDRLNDSVPKDSSGRICENPPLVCRVDHQQMSNNNNNDRNNRQTHQEKTVFPFLTATRDKRCADLVFPPTRTKCGCSQMRRNRTSKILDFSSGVKGEHHHQRQDLPQQGEEEEHPRQQQGRPTTITTITTPTTSSSAATTTATTTTTTTGTTATKGIEGPPQRKENHPRQWIRNGSDRTCRWHVRRWGSM